MTRRAKVSQLSAILASGMFCSRALTRRNRLRFPLSEQLTPAFLRRKTTLAKTTNRVGSTPVTVHGDKPVKVIACRSLPTITSPL